MPGTTPRARRADDAINVLAAGAETGGRFAVVELRERRGAGPPRHIHAREDEIVYILVGRVIFNLGRETVDARAGTCLILPRGGEHSYRIRSATARLLVIAVPAGIEGYYRELSRPAGPATGVGAVERLIVVAARHGVTITGPRHKRGRSPPSPAWYARVGATGQSERSLTVNRMPLPPRTARRARGDGRTE